MISLKVRDVMTQEVVTVEPETPLKDVARLMIDYGVSGIPVVDQTGLVVGVVSEADLLVKERGPEAIPRRPLTWLIGESKATERDMAKLKAVAAREAMTSPPVTIGPDRPLHEAADLMIRERINRLPVVASLAMPSSRSTTGRSPDATRPPDPSGGRSGGRFGPNGPSPRGAARPR